MRKFIILALALSLLSTFPSHSQGEDGTEVKAGDRAEKDKDVPVKKDDQPSKDTQPPISKTPESVWIWTFSRLPKVYKENKLFVKAVELAAKIAQSKVGQKAYSIINKKGMAFDKKEVDKTGKHPEIEVVNVKGMKTYAWAFYEHPSTKYVEDSIYWNKEKLDNILKIAQENKAKKNDILLFIAITILHETAHWKDQVIMGGIYRGEEGHKVNDRIFGKPYGDFDMDAKGCLERRGKKVSDELKAKWLNLDTWK